MRKEMKKDFRLVLWILCSLFVTGMISCETEGPECYEPVNVSAKSVFVIRDSITVPISTDTSLRDTTYITAKDTILEAPRLTALDLSTVFYQVTGAGVSVLGVALDPARDSMRFKIQADTLIAASDTITFYYKPSLFFISNNCGYTNYFTLDSIHITKNFFDSAVISNINVTKEGNTRNVLLYFNY